jgi:hypothetical protein
MFSFVILGFHICCTTAKFFQAQDERGHPAPLAAPQASRRQKSFEQPPQTFTHCAQIIIPTPPMKRKKGPNLS